MKLCTKPLIDDSGAPLVALMVGEQTAHLTTKQAEEIAESLNRGATASRYEAAIQAFLAKQSWSQEEQRYAIEQIRRIIEARRTSMQ